MLLGLASLPGCRRMRLPASPPSDSPTLRRLRTNLRLVPHEARIVLGLDLERLRASPAWTDLAAGPVRDAALLFDGFTKGVGIDTVEQIRQVLVAVPGERQSDDRLVVIVRSDHLAAERAAPWLRRHQGQAAAAFLVPPDGVVLATGAWAGQAMALGRTERPGGSLADHPDLVRLCERAAAGHALWIAAAVPADLRRSIITQDRFPDVASLTRLRAAVDLDRRFSAEVVAELSNAPDARGLAHRVRAYLDAAKRHPDMLAQGLAPYLEAVKLAPHGPNLHATLELPAAHAVELITRISDILGRAATAAAKAE